MTGYHFKNIDITVLNIRRLSLSEWNNIKDLDIDMYLIFNYITGLNLDHDFIRENIPKEDIENVIYISLGI